MLNNKFYIRAVYVELMNIGINIAFRYYVNMSEYRWKLSSHDQVSKTVETEISHRNNYKY